MDVQEFLRQTGRAETDIVRFSDLRALEGFGGSQPTTSLNAGAPAAGNTGNATAAGGNETGDRATATISPAAPLAPAPAPATGAPAAAAPTPGNTTTGGPTGEPRAAVTGNVGTPAPGGAPAPAAASSLSDADIQRLAAAIRGTATAAPGA